MVLLQEFRYALRAFKLNPAFSVACILILGLGIGANTAVFSVVQAVLLEHLPYKDPDRLVRLYEKNVVGENPYNTVSAPNFLDWQRQAKSFEGMGAYTEQYMTVGATPSSLPERARSALCSANVFSLLGAAPLFGRTFTSGEDQPTGEHVAVLSYGLWQRRFGSNQGVIGSSLRLDSQNYTIIGVMPARFQFPSPETLIWVPLQSTLGPEQMALRGYHRLSVIARLNSSATIESSRAELDGIAKRIKEQHPTVLSGSGATVAYLMERMVSGVRSMLLVLMGAAGLVLLICCVNVTNLLLARANARAREVGIRLALGASRVRLVYQFLVEGLFLSGCGAALGMAFALWGMPILVRQASDVPRIDAVRINSTVLVFTLVVAFSISVIMAVVPAFANRDRNLAVVLEEGGRGFTAGRRKAIFQSALIVAEVALSAILLVGCVFTIKSFVGLRSVDPGFATDNLLTMRFSLPKAQYSTNAQRASFFEHLLLQLRALPGVESAGVVSGLPVTGHLVDSTFTIEGHPALPPGQFLDALLRFADPDYFTTMRIPLQRGRSFSPADSLERANKVIISESMARKFFPSEDPLGRFIDRGNVPPAEIIGIVGDVRHELAAEPQPTMYSPLLSGEPSSAAIVLRTHIDPKSMVVTVQKMMREIDRDLPVVAPLTMQQIVEEATSDRQLNVILLAVFAGLAFFLAMIGLYAVMSYFVQQRRSEIGVRMALGADRGAILRLIAVQGLRLTVLGITVGLPGGYLFTALLRTQLFGVQRGDAPVYLLVAGVLTAVAALATLICASRAVRVDPVVTLRTE